MVLLAVISERATTSKVRVLVALRPMVDPRKVNVKRRVEKTGCRRVWA